MRTFSSQAAFTLMETIITVAIVAVAVGGLIAAAGVVGRFSTHQSGPVRTAAVLRADQVLRIAQDAWKYGSPGAFPSGTWETTISLDAPNAGPTTVPVTVTSSIATTSAQGASVTASVDYPPESQHRGDTGRASAQGQTQIEAPQPAARILNPSLIPHPSSAP